MKKEYWIIWGSDSHPGHTPGSSHYPTYEERLKVINDRTQHNRGWHVSSLFETDAKTGGVV